MKMNKIKLRNRFLVLLLLSLFALSSCRGQRIESNNKVIFISENKSAIDHKEILKNIGFTPDCGKGVRVDTVHFLAVIDLTKENEIYVIDTNVGAKDKLLIRLKKKHTLRDIEKFQNKIIVFEVSRKNPCIYREEVPLEWNEIDETSTGAGSLNP